MLDMCFLNSESKSLILNTKNSQNLNNLISCSQQDNTLKKNFNKKRSLNQNLVQDIENFPNEDFLQKHEITTLLRARLFDWMLEVFRQYQCYDETFFIGVSILDQFLQKTKKSIKKSQIHLISVVCIFIAAKINELTQISLNSVVNLISHSQYEKKDILEKEKEILETIQYKIYSQKNIWEQTNLILQNFITPTETNHQFLKTLKYVMTLIVYDYYSLLNIEQKQLSLVIIYISFKIHRKKFQKFQRQGFIKNLFQNQTSLEKKNIKKISAIMERKITQFKESSQYSHYFKTLQQILK